MIRRDIPILPVAVTVVVSREQKDVLKQKGWRVVAAVGGGHYLMESP